MVRRRSLLDLFLFQKADDGVFYLIVFFNFFGHSLRLAGVAPKYSRGPTPAITLTLSVSDVSSGCFFRYPGVHRKWTEDRGFCESCF